MGKPLKNGHSKKIRELVKLKSRSRDLSYGPVTPTTQPYSQKTGDHFISA